MHAVLARLNALCEPLAALLGDPGYYPSRFGFGSAPPTTDHPAQFLEWQPHFQVRVLMRYHPSAARACFTLPPNPSTGPENSQTRSAALNPTLNPHW